MSTSLEWSPAKVQGRQLNDNLKFCLRKSYGDPVDVVISSADITYLKGLMDAGIKDAEILIDAIGKHGEIRVKEVF